MSTFAADATSVAREIATILRHFLWQGATIGLVTAALLAVVRRSRPGVRYTTALLGLCAMAVAPAVTAACLSSRDAPAETAAELAWPVDSAAAPESGTHAVRLASGDDLSSVWRRAQPWCAACWGVGVCVMAMRLWLGWWMVRRLQRTCAAPDGDLLLLVARLTRALGLRRPPRVGVSSAVREAMVVGIWRPLILVPAAWLIELPSGVLEAVLAHELAHVRRWDPWVNAFQRVLETLLFFHPAVWWLSRRIRVEREFCCDAAAIRVTGEPVVYAQTLELVARRRMTQRVPLFASGIGDPHMTLLQRVKQALGRSGDDRPAGWLSPLVATLLLVAGIAVYRMAIDTPSPLYAQEGERERERERDESREREESPEREGAERERERDVERERREDRNAEERAQRDEARRQQELAERAALQARDQAEQARREAGEVIRRLEMEVQELRRALEEAHRRTERQAVETQMQAQQRDLEAQRRALDAEFQATAQRGLEQAGRERPRPPREAERPDAPRPPDRPNVPRLPDRAEGAEEPRRRVVVEFERMEAGRVPTEAGPQIREELNDLRNQVRELSEAVRNLQRAVESRGPDAPRGPEGARGPDGPQPPFGRGFPGFGPMRFGEERGGERARRPGRERLPEGDRRPEGDRPDAERPPERDRPGADRAPERDRPDGGDRPRGELPGGADRRPDGDRPDGDRRPEDDRPREEDRRPDRDRADGAAAVTPPGASGDADVAVTGVVRVYQLKEALAGDVVKSIKPIVVGVQAAADVRTNSVIVSGTPEQHQTIEVFVRNVDRASGKDAAPAADAVEGEQASSEPSADDAGAAAEKPEQGDSPEAAFEQDVSEDKPEKQAD